MADLEAGSGVVTAWQEEQGLGEITVDGGPKIWAHYSTIEMEGYRTLEVGQPVDVTYEAFVDQDGYPWRAVRVVPRPLAPPP